MRKDKTPRSQDMSVKDAFNRLLESYALEDKFAESKLMAAWGEVVGKPAARRTQKLQVRNRILYVQISSAPLRQELRMQKELVLKRLLEAAGKPVISDIIFN